MKIVAIRRGKSLNGPIEQYKLEDGRIVDHEQAAQMVESGELKDYLVGRSNRGRLSVRTRPNLDEDDNIGNLPSF